MLNWMNYAASLTTNQRINLRNEARLFAQTPQGVMSFVMERLSPATLEPQSHDELLAYLRAGTNWTASDNELRAKVAGVMHLVLACRTTSWFEALWHSHDVTLRQGRRRRVHLGLRRAGVPSTWPTPRVPPRATWWCSISAAATTR